MSVPETEGLRSGNTAKYFARIAVIALVALSVPALLLRYHDGIALEALVEQESELRRYYAAHPALTLALALLAYIAVTSLPLPWAAAMSVIYGWLFGFWPALVVVSFGSAAGATIAFLLSRHLIGHAIQKRYGERFAALNAAIEREGAFYLFTLRLIPQVPYFAINVGMGLTKMRTRTFWWVSQLGMLPGTCAFVLAGASAPSLKTVSQKGLASIVDWRLMLSLALLGLLPLGLKWTLKLVRRPR